jgi:hypothetical protein
MGAVTDGALAARAEEVRAYLVALRGGAPFLSGPDGRVLVAWLEAGVSTAAITAAIDGVAERRRRKRVKSRLTLWACRTELDRIRVSDAPSGGGGIAGWIAELQATELGDGSADARAELVQSLEALEGETSIEARADRAIAAVRRFHESMWRALGEGRAAVEEDARRELGPLLDGMEETKARAAIEEVARDLVRARYPLVAAKVAWDRLREDGA